MTRSLADSTNTIKGTSSKLYSTIVHHFTNMSLFQAKQREKFWEKRRYGWNLVIVTVPPVLPKRRSTFLSGKQDWRRGWKALPKNIWRSKLCLKWKWGTDWIVSYANSFSIWFWSLFLSWKKISIGNNQQIWKLAKNGGGGGNRRRMKFPTFEIYSSLIPGGGGTVFASGKWAALCLLMNHHNKDPPVWLDGAIPPTPVSHPPSHPR